MQFNWKANWWVVLLLALAAMHCAQCIFFDNYSFLDLLKFENGQEAMPFQGRAAMAPLLKAAHGSSFLIRLGKDLEQTQGQFVHYTVEPYSPEKLVCYAAGLLSIFWTTALAGVYGFRRSAQLWWIPPALFLAALYASYGARADQNLWYPYDLPHAALFTTGLLGLLSGSALTVAVAFALDCPMRETAIYLLPCILTVGYARKDLRRYGALAASLFLLWLPIRLAIAHHFRANPSDLGLHYHQDAHAFLQPKHLPQVASAAGFLWLPVLVWRRFLPTDEYTLLLGALPGVVFSGIFGIWYETRVWSEWTAIAACLAGSIFLRYLAVKRPIP